MKKIRRETGMTPVQMRDVLFRAITKIAKARPNDDPLVTLFVVNEVAAEIFATVIRETSPEKLLESGWITKASTLFGSQLAELTHKALSRHMAEHLGEKNAAHIMGRKH